MKTLSLFFLFFLFIGCAPKKPGIEISEDIWPYELYLKFNLRTIVSSYGNHLTHYCTSYPKDYFKADKVYMPNTQKVIIKSKTRYLSFKLVGQDKVIVEDIVEGSYKATHLHTIYYNEEFDDYRAEIFFIKQKENCQEFVIPNDENVSE